MNNAFNRRIAKLEQAQPASAGKVHVILVQAGEDPAECRARYQDAHGEIGERDHAFVVRFVATSAGRTLQ